MNTVDIFSGAGGFSTGASQAGARVLWAANHWREAVDFHSKNHPQTAHVCQDLNLFPSTLIPNHDLLLASPSCKGFSPARGKDQAHHDRHRATAWIVIDILEAKRPEFAVVENVPEMKKWVLYPSWIDAVSRLGYSISENIIDAASCGVPQNRIRLFIVLTRSRKSFELKIERKQEQPISSVLNWEAGNWSDIFKKNRSEKTIQRIQNAVCDGMGDRFLTAYYGATRAGRSIERPIGTLTTKPRYALIQWDRKKMRMLSVDEARAAMGFPDSYILPKRSDEANMMLGNAVCPPVAKEIVSQIIARG